MLPPPTDPSRDHSRDYPREDFEGTEMFRPFFKRRRTWMVATALVLFFLTAFGIRLEDPALLEGLDTRKVALGMGIFICIAFLWMTEAMPLAATAILVPVLASLTGVSDVPSSLVSFSDPLIFLFFGGFALASAMTYQGVDRWIAHGLVRLGGGRFITVACLLFCGTALISMWMSNTATAAMMIPLALGILGHLHDGENTRRNRNFLLLGLAYAASIGGLGTVIGSPPNGIAASALGLSFGEWLKFGIPMVMVLLPSMTLLLLVIFRPARGQRILVETTHFEFNWHRSMTVVIFAATCVCWIFGGLLGPLIGITKSFDTVVALAAVFALLYFRVVRWRDISRGTDWGVLVLFGGGIALSGVLKDTGASLFLARLLTGVIHDWPLVGVIAAVVFFVIFLTELSSNTAIAAMFVPIFASVAVELEVPSAQLILPLAVAASCAFMMPVATPPNAIVFGTGMVAQRDMMRAGLVLNLAFTVILTALAMLFF